MQVGKVGQSLSRCVRSILDKEVNIDDVFVVISRTRISTRDKLREVMEEYTFRGDATSLYGYDIEDIMTVAYKLWDDGKLHQPRLFDNGWQFERIAEHVWFDIVPTPDLTNPTVIEAYQQYEMLRRLAE